MVAFGEDLGLTSSPIIQEEFNHTTLSHSFSFATPGEIINKNHRYAIFILACYTMNKNTNLNRGVCFELQWLKTCASLHVVTGSYCILLTVDDHAGNHRRARRFLVYDNTTSVSISEHPEDILFVSSAAPNTSYLWVTSTSDETSPGPRVSTFLRVVCSVTSLKTTMCV